MKLFILVPLRGVEPRYGRLSAACLSDRQSEALFGKPNGTRIRISTLRV